MNKPSDTVALVFSGIGVILALIVLLGTVWVVGYGWVTNLKELVKLLGQQDYSNGMVILRGFGVLLAPLGAILGYVI